MSDFLRSSLWYRVADLRPRLRAGVRVQRQRHRNQLWHQLTDRTTGRSVRLNEAAYRFVGRMDASHGANEIWNALLELDGERVLTQDEAIRVMGQLSNAGLLQCELTPDLERLFREQRRQVRRRRWMDLNPLAVRVRVLNPSPLLDALEAWPARLFNPAALGCWLMLVLAAAAVAAAHWAELAAHAGTLADSPRALLIAWCAYPLLKALHELGHALAVRRWGGAVTDVGFTLFVVVPVPYVDASAASAFTSRFQRALVSASGIMVELFVAGLALVVWLNVQPGWARDSALVVMLIAAVSTLIFNGNPLLRFDGYHLMCDLLDLPNLDSRSRAWWRDLIRRRIFGVAEPAVQPGSGERKWLFAYAPLAWLFRVYVGFLIAFWLGTKSAALGLALAALVAILLIIAPFVALARSVTQTADERRRRRALRIAWTGAAAVAALALFLPLPHGSVTQAVAWLPEQAHVRAETEGFVQDLRAHDGESVAPGQVLALIDDPVLLAKHVEAVSRRLALGVRHFHAMQSDPVGAQNLLQAIEHADAEVARLDARVANLQVRTAAAGRLLLSREQDLPGAYLKNGQVLGYVLAPQERIVRAVVANEDASLVLERARSADVWFEDRPGAPVRGQVRRDAPGATFRLPSAALSDRNGGMFATDPADAEHLRTMQAVFAIDVVLPPGDAERIGGRAWVRFDLGTEALAFQAMRAIRQLLLKHFATA